MNSRYRTRNQANGAASQFHRDIGLPRRPGQNGNKISTMHEKITLVFQPSQVEPRHRVPPGVLGQHHGLGLNRPHPVNRALHTQRAQHGQSIRTYLQPCTHFGNRRRLLYKSDRDAPSRKGYRSSKPADPAAKNNRVADHDPVFRCKRAPRLQLRRS